MTAKVGFRDAIRRYVPAWLSDRPQSNRTVGFRFLWSMALVLDGMMEYLVRGLQASWPGLGTSTALPLIARSRGMIRGENESDTAFATRLQAWLDKWRSAGSAEAIARAIHEYCANHPRVRIVTRGGYWVTLAQDGTITRTQAAWNWDGTSHPERASWWSEIWIIVYPTQWAHTPGVLGDPGEVWGIADGLGIGHDVRPTPYEELRGLVMQWKSAHTKVRAIVWTSDAALFDPAVPGSLPNGTWGAWGTTGAGARVASGRNLSTCRYWEF